MVTVKHKCKNNIRGKLIYRNVPVVGDPYGWILVTLKNFLLYIVIKKKMRLIHYLYL